MNGSAAKPLVEAVHPLLGARITRLDLRGLLDPRLKQTLRENLAEYGVLYFPQQSIDPDDQSAFASLFGQVDFAGT
ncbi:MAG: TauD/TfdA family dioxygenase, partial [Pseudomonadota bacterium]|nr:TauD/TfdA family dioxygenase [Pseudomonadota bacterium]